MSRANKHETHIHGNIDKLTQIGKAENVIIQSTSMPAWPELMEHGHRFLLRCSYEEAKEKFEEAIRIKPDSSDSYYYAALASLGGRRPKSLTLTQIQSIEQKLMIACDLVDTKAHYFYLWALVKYDFYVANGFLVRPPSVEEILYLAENCKFHRDALSELLEYTNMPNSPISNYMQKKLGIP